MREREREEESNSLSMDIEVTNANLCWIFFSWQIDTFVCVLIIFIFRSICICLLVCVKFQSGRLSSFSFFFGKKYILIESRSNVLKMRLKKRRRTIQRMVGQAVKERNRISIRNRKTESAYNKDGRRLIYS